MIELLEVRIAPAVLLTQVGQLATQFDAPHVVTTDFAGNIIVAGTFHGTIDVNLGAGVTNLSTTDNGGDVYLAKYDSDYRLLWATTWGGSGLDEAHDIVTDSSGDVYVTGTFYSSNAGFGGSGPLNAGSGSRAFIFKLSGVTGAAATDFADEGQTYFGNGTNFSNGNTLLIENSGTLLFGGDFQGNGNGLDGGGSYSTSDRDGIVLRIDPSTGAQDFGFGSSFGAIIISPSDTSLDSVFKIEVGEGVDLFIGYSSNVSSTTDFKVVRYNSTGTSPVQTYGNFGVVNLGTDSAQVDFLIDNAYQVTAAAIDSTGVMKVFRYFSANGNVDPTYGLNAGAGFALFPEKVHSVSLGVDNLNRLFLAGEAIGKDYLARFDNRGAADPQFGNGGLAFFGGPNSEFFGKNVGLAVDPDGYIILNGGYVGNPDLDPGSTVKKLPARFVPNNDSGSSIGDSFLLRLDPNGAKAGQPYVFSAGTSENHPDEMLVVVSVTGPGRAHVVPSNDFGTGSLDAVELFDTTLATNLKIDVIDPFATRAVGAIFTHSSLQHVGSITVSPALIVGYEQDIFDPQPAPFHDFDQRDGFIPTILVTGKLLNLNIGNVEAGATIRLGSGLPYNEPDSTTPDTYNNRPNLTIGEMLGDDILIDVTGDGVTPGGVGGGGLGRVVIGGWAHPGLIRTTQGVGSFTILNGDFLADIQVDKFHLGESTTANVGEMTVQNGAWGSSGSEVEGNIAEFNAEAFLAGASITAGSITELNIEGDFKGTVQLTEKNANSFGTFNVTTDFTGKIESLSPLKKLNIKGDFKGSLKAPAIASITAFSFIGTTAEDGEGDPNKLNITTTTGLLGKITAKSGTIVDYEFTSPVAFGGIKIALKNLVDSTIAVSNVIVNAASIGPIDISLAGKANIGGVNLTGIANSSFTASGVQSPVTVKLKGGTGQSLGLSGVTFAANTIGKVTVAVNKGLGAAATAQAINVANFTATAAIAAVNISGDATTTQVNELLLRAGGAIAGVSVSAKTSALGSLEKSSVLAGQNVDLQAIESLAVLKRRLATGLLGPVKVSGSIDNGTIAAGGDVSKITVGVDLSNVRILAGALLGDDALVGGGDDRYHPGGQVGAIAIKGAFVQSTVSAGIDPVNGIFGDDDDVAATRFEAFDVIAAIKSISVGIEPTVSPSPALPHLNAIQAAAIGKITLGKTKLVDFTLPLLLDSAPTGEGGEGDEDIIVRLK